MPEVQEVKLYTENGHQIVIINRCGCLTQEGLHELDEIFVTIVDSYATGRLVDLKIEMFAETAVGIEFSVSDQSGETVITQVGSVAPPGVSGTRLLAGIILGLLPILQYASEIEFTASMEGLFGLHPEDN